MVNEAKEAVTMEDRAQSRPNVLVFLCDQLRIDLLHCYGSAHPVTGAPLVRTPHLDALAQDSMVFERAYTPTAICSPARASLMTGLYAHSHHMFNNSTPRYSYCEHLRPDAVMLPDWIAANTPYESAYFGKWHVGTADDLFRSRAKAAVPPWKPSKGSPIGSSSHPM